MMNDEEESTTSYLTYCLLFVIFLFSYELRTNPDKCTLLCHMSHQSQNLCLPDNGIILTNFQSSINRRLILYSSILLLAIFNKFGCDAICLYYLDENSYNNSSMQIPLIIINLLINFKFKKTIYKYIYTTCACSKQVNTRFCYTLHCIYIILYYIILCPTFILSD